MTTAEFVTGGSRLDYSYDDLNGFAPLDIVNLSSRNALLSRTALPQTNKIRFKAMRDELSALFGNEKSIGLSANQTRVVLGPQPTVLKVAIPREKLETAEKILKWSAATPEEGPAMFLHIEGVKATSAPGVTFRVFINEDAATANTTPAEANYVGSIGLFQAFKHGGHDHGADVDNGELFSFDISALVNRLKNQGKWDPNSIRVTIVPKGVGNVSAPKAEVSFTKISLSLERP